jgi:hypothetical protein
MSHQERQTFPQSLVPKFPVSHLASEQFGEIVQDGSSAQEVLETELGQGKKYSGKPVGCSHLTQNFLVNGAGVII